MTNGNTSGCESCQHCDTSEAGRLVGRSARFVLHQTPGICTRAGNFFDAHFVPAWLTGCPDFESVSRQADVEDAVAACLEVQ